MLKKMRADGFSATVLIIALLVITLVGFAGWLVRANQTEKQPASTNTTNDSQTDGQNEDPTESGKYLYIKEWGVRAALPEKFRSSVVYVLDDQVVDPTGSTIQAAKIYALDSLFPGNDCAAKTTINNKTYFSVGGLYIKSEADKPFNETRYKPEFKKNVLVTSQDAFHLSFTSHVCLGGQENFSLFEELFESLSILEEV